MIKRLLLTCLFSSPLYAANEAPAARVEIRDPSLSRPCRILVDKDLGVLVSNIRGNSASDDKEASLARLKLDAVDKAGKALPPSLSLAIATGGKDKVVLSAPKGMAMMDGKLLACDLDKIAVFELNSKGALRQVNLIPVSGAKNLEAIVCKGRDAFVTDSLGGRILAVRDLLDKDHRKTEILLDKVPGPRGMIIDDTSLKFVCDRSASLWSLSLAGGKPEAIAKLPAPKGFDPKNPDTSLYVDLVQNGAGEIYVLDRQEGRILVVDPLDGKSRVFAADLRNPSSMALIGEQIAVVQSFSNNIILLPALKPLK
ncbi:MAG: hypothetical protein RL095_3911 [Verrucomicrobiota bacterium]|jgi:hypothetical protein